MQRLQNENSEEEDGNTMIQGLGEGKGDKEDGEGEPNAEASGFGERTGEWGR